LWVRGISFGMPVVPPESWKTAGSSGSMAIASRSAVVAVGSRVEELGEGQEARGSGAVDDGQAQGGRGGPHPVDDLPEVGVPGPSRHHAGDGFGQSGELLQLPVAVLGQRHDRDRTELLQCHVQVGERRVVGQLHDDPVQRAQAEVVEVAGEPLGARVDLAVGDVPPARVQRDAVGVGGEVLGEHVAQRSVAPVAALAVAGGDIRGEGDDAVEGHRATPQVVAAKPPSITTISPLTNDIDAIRATTVSATSSAVTQRRSGVSLARRSMSRS
jgi:hypothetical protein